MGALCFHSLIVPPIEAGDTCLTQAESTRGLEVKALGSSLNSLDWRALFQTSDATGWNEAVFPGD